MGTKIWTPKQTPAQIHMSEKEPIEIATFANPPRLRFEGRLGAATLQTETRYRGYRITAERIDHYWRLSVHPTRPDAPILFQHTFSVPQPTMSEALAVAKRQIDRLLAA